MRLITLLFSFLLYSTIVLCQTSGSTKPTNDSLAMLEGKAQKWLKELYEGGIWADSDTVHISPEFKKLISDTLYRSTVYPEKYTWEQTIAALKANQIKKSFWFFINLYPESEKNKELVLNSIYLYSKVYEVEKIVSAAFYTYCYTDPTIGTVKENKPIILHPDVMEKKLSTANEIIARIMIRKKAEEK